jgi:hypothetical protein
MIMQRLYNVSASHSEPDRLGYALGIFWLSLRLTCGETLDPRLTKLGLAAGLSELSPHGMLRCVIPNDNTADV